ncbi:iron ABC transporter permease [Prevotella brunnea]|uniref:Iron ABC transporter permease n=1 Tax=Prevotella brunnea TaxID=2508867 RepID=A0A5C8GE96_9BACT|nr:iron ABC transporter permease [Prevotella brunnea]MDR0185731.1 iron ABC transporter permease [Prevotella brunnea]TXJ60184.1 iron ABC transporter permease [Prevotella brunnea]
MTKGYRIGGVLILGMAVLFMLNLCIGSVKIPVGDVLNILLGRFDGKESWRYIVMENRLPQTLTAVFCGGALAVSGLMLQTAFRNPLAGPDVFGINSGAGLGVALVMLLLGGNVSTALFSVSGFLAILLAAFVGAMAVTALIFFFSIMVKNSVLLLIIGIMVGYVSSSIVSLLNFFATAEGVKSYMIWGLGNFGGVSSDHIPLFVSVVSFGILCALLLIKPLNALLLGPQYAESLGINTRRVRNYLLVVTGLLSAITTAFCGPIAFIGLAVPHIARLLFTTENHRLLLPSTILCGSLTALLCNLICYLPGDGGIIPLNAVTPLIGAPVIIYVLMKGR